MFIDDEGGWEGVEECPHILSASASHLLPLFIGMLAYRLDSLLPIQSTVSLLCIHRRLISTSPSSCEFVPRCV